MANQKRMSLYFNLDVPMEKELWDYLESTKRKSEVLKRLLSDKLNGVELSKPKVESNNNISIDEIEDIFNI